MRGSRGLRAFAAGLLAGSVAAVAESYRPELMPREREVAAALAAGPPHFAGVAGVWVLGAEGFERARESANGFECLVARSHPGAFEPMCFDAEGARTLLEEVLLTYRLRMSGASEETIDAEIGRAYAEGRLRAPARPGINYMLSTENRVPIDERGTIAPFPPHLMFYAPYLRDEDFGVEDKQGPLFLILEGTPSAYVIVPVATGGGHEAHP